MPKTLYVIKKLDDDTLFWSSDYGWAHINVADTYSEREVTANTIPDSLGGIWSTKVYYDYDEWF